MVNRLDTGCWTTARGFWLAAIVSIVPFIFIRGALAKAATNELPPTFLGYYVAVGSLSNCNKPENWDDYFHVNEDSVHYNDGGCQFISVERSSDENTFTLSLKCTDEGEPSTSTEIWHLEYAGKNTILTRSGVSQELPWVRVKQRCPAEAGQVLVVGGSTEICSRPEVVEVYRKIINPQGFSDEAIRRAGGAPFKLSVVGGIQKSDQV
jgi:hypothetical protein